MPLGRFTLFSTKLDTTIRLKPKRAASAIRCSVRARGAPHPRDLSHLPSKRPP